MNGAAVEEAVEQMSRDICRRHAEGTAVVLVGIQTGGVHLARRLAGRLAREWRQPVPVGQLDVAMHRDDLDQRLAPKIHPTAIAFDVSGKEVILVDDVLCSGRTIRAALDALLDLGRPRRVELAVLIERPHRELPIQADFVGATLPTRPDDRVDVQLVEGNGVSQVVVESAPRPAPGTS
jgi:pyrimidine operon attenuation protein/uracil phosphoribosyltransferase